MHTWNSSDVQTLQDLSQIREMLLFGGSCHQDVIQVYTDSRDSLEEILHHPLENGWCRCDPERESCILEQSFMRVDRDVLLRLFIQRNLQVGVREVEFREGLASRE